MKALRRRGRSVVTGEHGRIQRQDAKSFLRVLGVAEHYVAELMPYAAPLVLVHLGVVS